MMLLKAKQQQQQHHSKREKGRDCCRWSSSLLFVSRGASTGTHFIRQIVRVFVVDLNSLSPVHLWVQEICSSCQSEQDHATPLDVDFPSFRSRRAPLCNNISGEKVRKRTISPVPSPPPSLMSFYWKFIYKLGAASEISRFIVPLFAQFVQRFSSPFASFISRPILLYVCVLSLLFVSGLWRASRGLVG